MHNLPFSWLRRKLINNITGTLVRSASASVGLAVTDRKNDAKYWTCCQRLLPHANACWKLNSSIHPLTESDLLASHEAIDGQVAGLANLTDLFRTHQNLDCAEQALKCAFDLAEKYPQEIEPRHVHHLFNMQGHLLKDRGKHQEALEAFTKARDGYELLEKQNPNFQKDRLDIQFNVASECEKLGRRDIAIELYDELLSVYERKQEKKLDWLSCLELRANLYYNRSYTRQSQEEKNDLQAACNDYRTIYQQYRIMYGENMWRVSRAAYNLANAYVRLGDMWHLRAADILYERAFPVALAEKPDSTLTFNIQLEHGELSRRLYRFERAEDLLVSARDNFSRIQKPQV